MKKYPFVKCNYKLIYYSWLSKPFVIVTIAYKIPFYFNENQQGWTKEKVKPKKRLEKQIFHRKKIQGNLGK